MWALDDGAPHGWTNRSIVAEHLGPEPDLGNSPPILDGKMGMRYHPEDEYEEGGKWLQVF